MKLVMTLMVRDEADIIAAMIEHHLAQGVDLVIATDNGSVDGTREILARYAERGLVELHDDPRQQKQQSEVVTRMARLAATEHGADWVLNADADEFWVPVDRSLTLRQALSQIPTSLVVFEAPVVNLTGTPARAGTGLRRLVWRDERSTETLLEVAALHSQPSSNAVHRGDPDVWVAQGNHFTNLESQGRPDPAYSLEVLHLPWRSLAQHVAKVEMTGRAYDGNPDALPSPSHHGMRDYRRLRAGYVEPFYLYRHPVDPEHDESFVRDTTVLDSVTRLAGGAGVFPDLLEPLLADAVDEPFDSADITATEELVRIVLPIEREHIRAGDQRREFYNVRNERRKAKIAELKDKLKARNAELEELKAGRPGLLRRRR